MKTVIRYAVVFSMVMGLLSGCTQRSDRVVAVVIHPAKPKLVYAATEEAVYKTRDGGQSWEAA